MIDYKRKKLLFGNPWPDLSWEGSEKPIIIVDGKIFSLKNLEQRTVTGENLYGCNAKNIDLICTRVNTSLAHFYEMRVEDLSPLKNLQHLRHLAIRWNTKAKSIEPIGTMSGLNTLILEDTPKVASLDPLAALSELEHLEYSGGIWNSNRSNSLNALAALKKLKYLGLLNLKLSDNSLKPIAECKSIVELNICNKFKTEEFAFLAANMPNVECDKFQAYVKLSSPIGENDVMVVGSRKPFLNSVKDKDRLLKYETNFAKLVKKHKIVNRH